MRYYYYHRNPNGEESARLIADEAELQDDFEECIGNLSPDEDYPAVETIDECPFKGEYNSILDYIEAKYLPYDGSVETWLLASLIGETKYGYPFGIIEHPGGRYEVFRAQDIPWKRLILEYGQDLEYEAGPFYFSETEIDAVKAEEQGYKALARLIREQGA